MLSSLAANLFERVRAHQLATRNAALSRNQLRAALPWLTWIRFQARHHRSRMELTIGTTPIVDDVFVVGEFCEKESLDTPFAGLDSGNTPLERQVERSHDQLHQVKPLARSEFNRLELIAVVLDAVGICKDQIEVLHRKVWNADLETEIGD